MKRKAMFSITVLMSMIIGIVLLTLGIVFVAKIMGGTSLIPKQCSNMNNFCSQYDTNHFCVCPGANIEANPSDSKSITVRIYNPYAIGKCFYVSLSPAGKPSLDAYSILLPPKQYVYIPSSGYHDMLFKFMRKTTSSGETYRYNLEINKSPAGNPPNCLTSPQSYSDYDSQMIKIMTK